jgi:hypothetical protein
VLLLFWLELEFEGTVVLEFAVEMSLQKKVWVVVAKTDGKVKELQGAQLCWSPMLKKPRGHWLRLGIGERLLI